MINKIKNIDPMTKFAIRNIALTVVVAVGVQVVSSKLFSNEN